MVLGKEFRSLFSLLAIVGSIGLIGCSNAPEVQKASELENADGIIGGRDIKTTDAFRGHITALYNSLEGSLCTASILSDSILVTAAHCVEGADARFLKVVFGDDLTTSTPAGLVIRTATSYEQSPVWLSRRGEKTNTGDIAIVHFPGGLPAGYKPAEVLTDATKLIVGAKVTLAGYGASIAKQNSATGVWEHEGSGSLRVVQTSIKDMGFSVSEVVLEQSQGKGACHGDSGGPAYIKIGNKYALFGVTSRGVDDDQDTCGVSSAYTNIPFYARWVTTTANRLIARFSQPTSVSPVRPLIVAAGIQ